MKNKGISRAGLAALGMFTVFAIAILSVLLGGASAYRRLTGENAVHFGGRTATQYLATKLRQVPSPEGVSADFFGSGDALCITQVEDGFTYVTRIYCHNGWLMELFTPDEEGFLPEDGEKILPANALAVTETGGLFTLAVTDANGEVWEIALYVRGSEVGMP